MKDEKFTEYTRRCIELSREGGWEKAIKAKEQLAWELHAEFPPTGSLLLGDLLLQQKRSYLKEDLKAKDFAKALVAKAVEAVQAREGNDGWDYYYLGLTLADGRG